VDPGQTGGPRRESGDVLTAEEMEPWGAQELYVVVQRLRPRWLQVRFMNSRDATTQHGLAMMSGALVITTGRGAVKR